jgi:hypothetical protein
MVKEEYLRAIAEKGHSYQSNYRRGDGANDLPCKLSRFELLFMPNQQ